jgi:hypothetical protein
MTDYYVDGAVGNDSNLGTSEGSGNAWATIQKAATTMVGGDKVYIKGSATYTEDVAQTAVGNAASPIVYEGYTSTTGDRGRIDWVAATTHCFQHTGNSVFTYFYNVEFTGATYCIDGNLTADGCIFFNVRFSNASSDAQRLDNSTVYINCDSINNGGTGYDGDSSCKIYFCTASGNNRVCNALDWFSMVGCVFNHDGPTNFSVITGDVQQGCFNTIWVDTPNHTSQGFGSASTAHGFVIGNILARVDNGGAAGYAIANGSTVQPVTRFYAKNWTYNFNSAFQNTTYEAVQWDNVDGTDPEFVSVPTDFSLADTSPLISAGYSAGVL